VVGGEEGLRLVERLVCGEEGVGEGVEDGKEVLGGVVYHDGSLPPS